MLNVSSTQTLFWTCLMMLFWLSSFVLPWVIGQSSWTKMNLGWHLYPLNVWCFNFYQVRNAWKCMDLTLLSFTYLICNCHILFYF
jgi:hypothetical protein